MTVDKAKTTKMRTWFGVKATITIGPGFIHKAGLGGFLIPHPPVINWLLRQGLREDMQYTLSCTHEFGVVMLALAFVTGHASLLEIVLILTSTHAAWEVMSEILTITTDVQLYREYYQGITIIPRIVFWISMGTLTVIGWIIVLPVVKL
jgi:hypothetical protein